MKNPIHFVLPIFVLWALILTPGCSPETKKKSYLATADRFFDSGEYTSAEVEYLNVLKLEPQNARSIGRLGIIYSEQGRLTRAIIYLRKGHELQPEDLELRLKLGQLAQATGNHALAKDQANFVLERRPTDSEAPQLLVTSTPKTEELAALREALLKLSPPAAQRAPVLTALATIEIRQGRIKEGEELLRQATTADPKFATAQTVLGSLYLTQKNIPSAGKAFKQAADLSPPRSPKRLQYAQFLGQTGNLAGAKKLLAEMNEKTPDYMPPWITRAEIALTEKNYAECADSLTKALGRDPGNLEASLLNGRLQMAKGENDSAITTLEKIITAYPKLPVAHLDLGRAYAASGNLGQALDQLNQAVALAPDYVDGVLQLAALQIRKGDPGGAVLLLSKFSQRRPDVPQVKVLLANAYLVQNDLDAAMGIYRQLDEKFPGNNQISLLIGTTLVRQKKLAEARQIFSRAFEQNSDNAVALEQLVNLDLTDGKPQAAHERVEAAIAKNPKLTGSLQLLLAKIFLSQKKYPEAEAALKKTMDFSPELPTPYFLLAGIYSATDQNQKALESLQQVVVRNPRDSNAFMMIAAISDKQKNYAAAREAYEKIIAINPRSTNALNNLAYLYSERFDEQEKAYELAQRARDLQPNSPNVADTLGRILYKRRQYSRSLILLQESVDKMPESDEIIFHLGMAHYMMGEESAARMALQRALKSGVEFTGSDEAKEALAVLDLDLTRSTTQVRQTLDEVLGKKKDDPVALIRLASLHEREGNHEKAIAALDSVLLVNGKNVNALVNLARVHRANNDNSKALEAAKNARKFAPGDAAVAHILGRIAYETGDYPWAASLLQEAARKESASPDLLLDLAEAVYSVGQVKDAEKALRDALQPGGTFLREQEARRFLQLLSLASHPGDAEKELAQIERTLELSPDYVPALMVSATVAENKSQASNAEKLYKKALEKFPDFSPAKVRLAVLAAAKPEFNPNAYQLATQARAVYPADAELAKALGILSYRKGDFGRSISLLKESSLARGSDADVFYFLGMAQYQEKEKAASKQSLVRALELNLNPDFTSEATRVLNELK